ncbi:MAG: 4Fe-4S dicluster domain-containing protein [Nitrospinota bacterium]
MTRDQHIEDERSHVEIGVEVDGRKGRLGFEELKAGGFIKQRQRDLFTIRCRCPGGMVSAERLRKIAEVAERFGKGYVHLSVRQSVEIPYVHYRDFGPVVEELRASGQEVASCGPRVRVPTACAGCEYNPNGLTDCQALARMVDERFFGRPCNHKFKISFSGCPIDCFRTSEMDLGFQGAALPAWSEESCIGCSLCAEACKEGAIEASEDGKPIYSPEKCIYCADCIRVCPTSSWRAEKVGHVVRVGGKHGRHPLKGSVIARFLPDELVPEVIEKTLDWYRARGEGKGRIRIGTLLQEGDNMHDYMAFMQETLGEFGSAEPPPPEPVDILR